MVRLWTLEAMAHGAEFVSYFRWRQAPFAQEQMHAGLLRPDSHEAPAAAEVRHAARDIAHIGAVASARADVALVFSYASDWVTDVEPHGRGFKAIRQAFEAYSALRALGLSVDIISSAAAIDGYAMLVIPCEPIIDARLIERLRHFDGQVIIGPRGGSKTQDFQIPANLAPGPLQALIPLVVTRVESLRDAVAMDGAGFAALRWVEHVDTQLTPQLRLADGRGVAYRHGGVTYLAAWLDDAGLQIVMRDAAQRAGVGICPLPEGLRLRRAGDLVFAFNYAPEPRCLRTCFADAERFDYLVGGPDLPPAGVAVWRVRRPV
jgi:beta-galactosidase